MCKYQTCINYSWYWHLIFWKWYKLRKINYISGSPWIPFYHGKTLAVFHLYGIDILHGEQSFFSLCYHSSNVVWDWMFFILNQLCFFHILACLYLFTINWILKKKEWLPAPYLYTSLRKTTRYIFKLYMEFRSWGSCITN